jgi:RHS repeat-associated protein
MWGLDLSGATQGAGGVGGLLAVNDVANGVHFAANDGNGNVAALVKGTDGTISAQYEYGPFAEPIRVTGAMGKTNPIRFSTKYTDDESDFLYYGFRYYYPSTGRWIIRDLIVERGGANLYQFINNVGPNGWDLNGLNGRFGPIPFSIPKPPLPRIPPDYDYCGCIEELIQDGKKELIRRYNNASTYLDARGLKPAAVPTAERWEQGIREASCIQSANSILIFISPTPPCWLCYVERREQGYRPFKFKYWDQNNIVCFAISAKGGSGWAIVFDWFHHKAAGFSHAEFSREYEDLLEQGAFGPYYDSNAESPHNISTINRFRAEDYNALDILFLRP